jgi:hypothetical protein
MFVKRGVNAAPSLAAVSPSFANPPSNLARCSGVSEAALYFVTPSMSLDSIEARLRKKVARERPAAAMYSVGVSQRFMLHPRRIYFVHLNYPMRFGWFTRVLSSPQSHRIHHSTLPEHMNKNFATILPLWDILFGTYHHPKQDEWPNTGVDGVTVNSLWQAIVLPFVSWGKMLREVLAGRTLDS